MRWGCEKRRNVEGGFLRRRVCISSRKNIHGRTGYTQQRMAASLVTQVALFARQPAFRFQWGNEEPGNGGKTKKDARTQEKSVPGNSTTVKG